jgi:2-polyprenyl-3-methyl-5-hydroxy-6-metoxy-1,4-benzoquinol methylase
MATTIAVDEAKVEAFAEKLLIDMAGATTTLLSALGDRLGLFRTLAEQGPATSAELATRAGVSERYAREWLAGLTAAGYLELDGADGRYRLPAEHVPSLAEEGGPFFAGGVFEMVPAFARIFDPLVEAFASGRGVAQDVYDARVWEGMERFTASWFENLLLQAWIPAMPELEARLVEGALVADVGCGSGRALVKLAQAFPRSRFVGYDAFEGQLSRAIANAERAGVTDRVRLELLDAGRGLPEQYDVITTFDVIHDAVEPRRLLRAIRDGLRPDGTYVMLEIRSADQPEENVGPLAAMFYGVSVFYCMTTSLAHGGEGLGTVGLPEAKVRELCAEAGFAGVRPLPLDNPFNVVYEIKR